MTNATVFVVFVVGFSFAFDFGAALGGRPGPFCFGAAFGLALAALDFGAGVSWCRSRWLWCGRGRVGLSHGVSNHGMDICGPHVVWDFELLRSREALVNIDLVPCRLRLCRTTASRLHHTFYVQSALPDMPFSNIASCTPTLHHIIFIISPILHI